MSSTFKFNMISDEGAKGLEDYYQELINKNAQGHFRYEAEMSMAFLSWRKGDAESTKGFFCSAASEVVEQLSSFTHFGTPRVIAEFETPLLIVNVFGSDAERKKLSSVRRDAWFYPVTDEFIAVADLLVLINKILISDRINLTDIHSVTEKNQSRLANKFYQPWIDSICAALEGVVEKNKEKVETKINEILALHERETDDGAWKKRVEAMISLWACAIYKIAINNSLEVNVNSPYLPKNIL